MAKRRSSTPRKRNTSERATPAKASTKAGVASARWGRWALSVMTALGVLGITVGLIANLRSARSDTPPTAYPVVTLADSPADAMAKSHARYLLSWADELDSFAERADTFTESGDAAKSFTERTAAARAKAYNGPGGFDEYVFGHVGEGKNGEDRYDPATLRSGAKEMAAASRKGAASILSGLK